MPRPDPVRAASHRAPVNGEDGSVMPLIVGMVMCLLLLGAGVTAATSAVLARASLQHMCDGAASAAADASQRTALTTALPASDARAAAAAAHYLNARTSAAGVSATLSGATVQLACSTEAPIAFGALFGSPTLAITVRSVAHAVLTPA